MNAEWRTGTLRFLNAPYHVIIIIIIIIIITIIIIIIIISLDRTWYLLSNKSRFLLEIILVGDVPMMAPSYFSDINGLSPY